MASLTTSTAPTSISGRLQKLWKALVEPTRDIANLAERRRIRFLSTLLLVYFAIGAFALIALPLISPESTTQLGSFFALLFVAVPYVISRTRYYQLAAYILILVVAAVSCFVPFFAGSSAPNPNRFSILYFMVFPVLVSSMVLSTRAVIPVILLALGFIASAPILQPQVGNISGPFIMIAAASILLYVFLLHRDGLERDRQVELQNALKEAELANATITNTNAEVSSKNQELARANALIREHARLKSEFLATMSHELRTPLNAIRGFTSIMLEGMGGEVDDEARHMLTRINSNGERLLNLINDVLDIAKIESGRLELVEEPLNMMELSDQWKQQMSVLAERSNLDFEISVAPDFPSLIYGNSQRITQIITNLLSNAFKFTKAGKVKLEISRNPEKWTARVIDTGIGIPPHALNFIFEEFRQVDGSSKREFGGTGLGLAIVRNLCRSMGGSVSVISELEKGSTFTVQLPLRTESVSAIKAP